jgi:hypothetical protein
MRWAAFLFVALVGCAATALPARAQVLQVSVQTARTNFLLYERVDLLVTIQNIGGTDLVLDNNEGHPWLSFLVSKHNRLPVRPERDSTFAALSLKAGETKTLRVNLTPLFAFRAEGQYTAAAVIDLPGAGQTISDSIPFSVQRGMKVWSQQRSFDNSERTYSLIRFSPDSDTTKLYLRVEDPAENIVYANLALGNLAAYIDPDVNFDPQGNIHVLQPIALSTYLYTRANADGKVLAQDIFRTYQQIPPRLYKMEDGSVTVIGGLEANPNRPRERLSDSTLKSAATPPPSPPPAPDALPPSVRAAAQATALEPAGDGVPAPAHVTAENPAPSAYDKP